MADKYKISRSSVANILRGSEEFLVDSSSNFNKRLKRKFKNENGQKVEELVFEWFIQQRVKHIPMSGPILHEKVKQLAESLAYSSEKFKISNGWLEKLCNLHSASFRTINGESASVDNSTMKE